MKEIFLFDKTKLQFYKNISTTGYIYNINNEPYTIIAIFFDVKKYILNDFKFKEVFIFCILFFSYVFYRFTFLPLLWLHNFKKILKILFLKIFKINGIIYKPSLEKLPLNYTLLNFIKSVYLWISADSYLMTYTFLKGRKLNFNDVIKSLAIFYSTGRPIWYFSFCIDFTTKIIKLLDNEVWARKKKKIWPKIFFSQLKLMLESFMFKKNFTYFLILSPLKIEISKSIHINGINFKLIGLKKLSVFSEVSSILGPSNPIPHLVFHTKEKDVGQVLTSSSVIKNFETNKYIQNRKVPSLNNKQFIVRRLFGSEIENNHVFDDIILRSAWTNLNLTTVESYAGFIFRLGLMQFQEEKLEFLCQNREGSKIFALPSDQEEIDKLLINEDARSTYFEFYGKVYSFGEKILQEDKIKEVLELHDYLKERDNETIALEVLKYFKDDQDSFSEFIEISQELRIKYSLLQNKMLDDHL